MKSSDLDGLLEKLSSKYAITMAVAQRAKQLESGARHFLEHPGDYTPVTAAIEEITQGKVQVEIAPEEKEETDEALASVESDSESESSETDDKTEDDS